MSFTKNIKGRNGEDEAAALLANKGFNIIERNYRFGKGEIDIIAEVNDELVFVEVKFRSSESYGHPIYALSVSKQKQIIRVAKGYIYERNIVDKIIRFDAVTIYENSGSTEIEHIENAFSEYR